MKKLIKDLVAGDVVTLDCGYGPHTDDQPCKILSIFNTSGLWGDARRSARVKMPSGEEFDTDWTLNDTNWTEVQEETKRERSNRLARKQRAAKRKDRSSKTDRLEAYGWHN